MARDDDRLAAALRENLRRRKAQGRGRADQDREPRPDADSVDPAVAATIDERRRID